MNTEKVNKVIEPVKKLKKRGRKKGFTINPDGTPGFSLTNEYYKLKMREVRKKNPLYTKKYVFLLDFDGKNYVFKYKGEILKNLINVNNNQFFIFEFNNKILKFNKRKDFLKTFKKIKKEEIQDDYIRMWS